jgi:hypothetical protein
VSGDREWAVRIVDTAPGMPERIVPTGSRHWANVKADRVQQLNATLGTYLIVAQVVWRYRFMPDMPWEVA